MTNIIVQWLAMHCAFENGKTRVDFFFHGKLVSLFKTFLKCNHSLSRVGNISYKK